MKNNYFTPALIALAISSAGAFAAENPVTVGISGLYVQSPYQGGKNKVYPLPLINYQGDKFFISGLQGGYYLWKGSEDQFSVILSTSGQEFDPGNSDDPAVKQMNKRHLTMMAGGMWQHIARWGVVKTSLVGDVLDQSNGFIWNTNWHYPLTIGRLAVNPGLGVSWNSAHQTDYYYGVSQQESARSGLSAYQASDSWLPYAEVRVSYALTQRWRLGAGGRYQWFGSEVKDSPLVAKSGQMMIWTGVSYTF